MIIGITGQAGAGKDVGAAYIAGKLGIPHVSGGDVIRGMLSSIGLEPTKTATVNFGLYLRTNYGPDAVANRALQKAEGKSFVYSGFRAIAEAQFAKNNGVLIYVDAPENLRHDRIIERSREGDLLDKDALKLNDQKEQKPAQTKEDEDIEAVKAMADYIILNDGTLEEYYRKLDEFCDNLNLE